MTQDTIRRGSVGTPTDGIGSRTTAHLNLTRSLADVDRDDNAMARAKARAAERRAYESERQCDRPFDHQNLLGDRS